MRIKNLVNFYYLLNLRENMYYLFYILCIIFVFIIFNLILEFN